MLRLGINTCEGKRWLVRSVPGGYEARSEKGDAPEPTVLVANTIEELSAKVDKQ